MNQHRGDHQFVAGWRICAAALLAMCISILPAKVVTATERKPLPPFAVSASDGRQVASNVLSTEGRWLIVYVTPGNPSCDRLLAALSAWRNNALVARIVVIVAGDLETARGYASPRLGSEGPAYAWYADVDRQARAALDLRDGPALVGIDKGTVEWSLAGVLNDPSVVESVVRSWLER